MDTGYRVMVGSERWHIPTQRRGVLILLKPRNATTGPAVVRSRSRQRGPPMLIGGSEALGGMQISPALLRYPSVPLPVLSNPFIPPDWRRGGRGGEHSCWFVASFPRALAVSREGGKGKGGGHCSRCCLD